MVEPESIRSRPLRIAIVASVCAWILGPVAGGVQAAILQERSSAVVAFTCLTITLLGLLLWIVLPFFKQRAEDRLSREAFAHAAERLRLAIDTGERRWADTPRFELFRRPGAWWLVLTGEVHGREVTVFQFREVGATRLGFEMVVDRYTCVAMATDAQSPHLLIKPRWGISRTLRRTRSSGYVEAFHRRMVVRCEDEDLATRVIGSLAARGAAASNDFTLEVADGYALCFTRRGPEAIEDMFDVLEGCVDALPIYLVS